MAGGRIIEMLRDARRLAEEAIPGVGYAVKVAERSTDVQAGAVRLICYEEVDAWILGKFALRLDAGLHQYGRESTIAKCGDANAEIGHHIIYIDATTKSSPIETLMVTHLDRRWKVHRVLNQLNVFDMAICMSEETATLLVRAGADSSKVTYVSPAHDLVIKPRPWVIGIAGKTHADGRRDPEFIVDMMRGLSPDDFLVSIMGSGWDDQVARLRRQGFGVTYRPAFEYRVYSEEFMPSLDFFLHWSWDEGSMAFLDAIAADARTLVNRQGFHLDIPDGIDVAINGAADANAHFHRVAAERRARTDRVANLSWSEYALRHMIIWDYLRGRGAQPAENDRYASALAGFERRCDEQSLDAFVSDALASADPHAVLAASPSLCQIVRLGTVRFPGASRLRAHAGLLYGQHD